MSVLLYLQHLGSEAEVCIICVNDVHYFVHLRKAEAESRSRINTCVQKDCLADGLLLSGSPVPLCQIHESLGSCYLCFGLTALCSCLALLNGKHIFCECFPFLQMLLKGS